MNRSLVVIFAAVLLSLAAAVAIAATTAMNPRPGGNTPVQRVTPVATPVDLNPCSSGACW